MSRRTLAAALILAVVLSGCNALPDGRGPTTAAMPAPTETARTAEPIPERPAPGLSADGVVDADALVAAHAAALSNATSYTYVSVVVIREGGRRVGIERTVQRVGADGRFRFVRRFDGRLPPAFSPRYDAEVYANARVTVVRLHREGETFSLLYPRGEGPVRASSPAMREFLRAFLSDLNVEVVERVERGGRTLYRLRARGDSLRFTFANATDVRATALVDARGFVRRLHVEYEATRGGWSGRIERTVTYREVGETTVERPGWVEAAIRNATRRGF